MDDHEKMIDQFSDFFENFFGSNVRNRRGMRAVIDSFEIYIINSLMEKKCLKLISCPKLFRVAQPKQKKNKNDFSSEVVEMVTFLACNFKLIR